MTLNICLLGQIKISRDGRSIVTRGTKPIGLLAYLLVTGKSHTRQHLVDLLFDGPDDPRASLRWTLSELRKSIGADFIKANRQQIAFNFNSDYWLDVPQFESGQTDLYRGDFLEGLNVRGAFRFEDWVLFERERLRRVYQSALIRRLENGERSGDDQIIIDAAHQLLHLDNLREEWYCTLMRAYARQGQREAALAQYDLCCQVLKAELSVEPAPATTVLAEAIQQGRLDKTSGFVDRTPSLSKLSPPPTHFVGRERELAELIQRLADPACRLLTLTGPGGIGKTRLAQELGNRLKLDNAFPGGIYFVPLAALNSVDFIVSTIAEALNETIKGGEEPEARLLSFLGEQKQNMLLVLDNFEQLAEGAGLLTAIVRNVTTVKLLVTSRERLNLQDEWLFDLQGLPFPSSFQPDEKLEDFSAVQLFLKTAARLETNFTLSDADKPYLVKICQLVEGMPLALELAAAWVRVLSCMEIAQEIEKGLEFLTTSLRDVPARHRSVIAAFDYSWNHLSSDEQRIFQNLAVFRGGFSRKAAEQVAGASLPFLGALLDKSMLRRNNLGRYELHELLRQYAAEKLDEAGKTEQVRNRHLAFFLKLAEKAEPELRGEEQVNWLKRLETENGNLRAALTWSLDGGEAAMGLRLATALGEFWYMRVHLYDEAIEWLDKVLSGTDPSEQPAVRARAYRRLGVLSSFQGNDATARIACEQSLALYQTLEDWNGIADTLFYLAEISGFQGDDAAACSFYAAARSAYEEGLVTLREQGDKWRLARSLNYIGEIARVEDDYVSARSFYQESLSIRRELGDQRGIALSLSNLGVVAHCQGDIQQAVKFLRESLVLHREQGEERGMVDCLEALAAVAGSTGKPAWAARLFGATHALREAIGTRLEYPDQIEYDNNVTIVRKQLDEETFTTAWIEGRAMTLEQAVDDVLATKID